MRTSTSFFFILFKKVSPVRHSSRSHISILLVGSVHENVWRASVSGYQSQNLGFTVAFCIGARLRIMVMMTRFLTAFQFRHSLKKATRFMLTTSFRFCCFYTGFRNLQISLRSSTFIFRILVGKQQLGWPNYFKVAFTCPLRRCWLNRSQFWLLSRLLILKVVYLFYSYDLSIFQRAVDGTMLQVGA